MDYRNVIIPLSTDNSIEGVIFKLFREFPKNEFNYKIQDNNLVIHLRELDFFKFKYEIEKLSSLYPDYKETFSKILIEIEKIKSYGLKGKKRVYIGYDKERKVKNRILKEIERGKYYYAQNHNFSRKNNPLPEKFKNKIIVGDSEFVLKDFPDNCIDLIFTSPPYNFGLDYETHKDGINWEEYFKKLFSIFDECIRILKYGGRIIINTQPLFSDYVPIHHIISNFFMEKKLIWKGEIIWDKHNYNCKYTAWGSWKSPSNPYLKYTWEFLEIFCKGILKHYGNHKNADISEEEFKKWVYAKWDINPEYNMKKYGHPAMFPEELCERVIKLFSFKGDIVLDPFNGVGTTTVVAKKLGRIYIGIDISPDYCQKAEERIKQEDQKVSLL